MRTQLVLQGPPLVEGLAVVRKRVIEGTRQIVPLRLILVASGWQFCYNEMDLVITAEK